MKVTEEEGSKMSAGWLIASAYAKYFDEATARQLGHLKPAVFEKGAVLFRPGDDPSGFVLVLSGRVGVFLTGRNGREILLYSVEPGETCVQTTIGLLGKRAYTGEAIAETTVSAILIPKTVFQDLLDSSSHFREFVFAAFGDRLADVTQMLEQVAFMPIGKRLASTLLERADKRGKIAATHQELAVAIGSSREVVSRRLEQLKAEGLVELDRGLIRIADPDGLAKFSS